MDYSNARSALQTHMGTYSMWYAALIVVLIIIVIAVSASLASCNSKSSYANGSVTTNGNFAFPGTRSMWWLGGADAGFGGPMHRDYTEWHDPRLYSGHEVVYDKSGKPHVINTDSLKSSVLPMAPHVIAERDSLRALGALSDSAVVV